MIIRKNLKWSIILRSTWKAILYFLCVALLAYFLYNAGYKHISIPLAAIGIMSTALSIFLAFRNNSAYDRWWEARMLWGSLINNSRSFARQVLSFVADEEGRSPEDCAALQKKLLYTQIAFAHALRFQLRRETDATKIASLLDADDYRRYNSKDHKPNYLLQLQAETLQACRRKGWLDDFRHMQIDNTLTEFSNILGGCERIKNTPLPRQYNYFPRLFVYIHATLLPFAFVELMNWLMIPLSVVVSYIFLSLHRIGEVTEDPFENRIQDVPLTALSQTIEINLREQLNETNLPAKAQPVDGFLF